MINKGTLEEDSFDFQNKYTLNICINADIFAKKLQVIDI